MQIDHLRYELERIADHSTLRVDLSFWAWIKLFVVGTASVVVGVIVLYVLTALVGFAILSSWSDEMKRSVGGESQRRATPSSSSSSSLRPLPFPELSSRPPKSVSSTKNTRSQAPAAPMYVRPQVQVPSWPAPLLMPTFRQLTQEEIFEIEARRRAEGDAQRR